MGQSKLGFWGPLPQDFERFMCQFVPFLHQFTVEMSYVREIQAPSDNLKCMQYGSQAVSIAFKYLFSCTSAFLI